MIDKRIFKLLVVSTVIAGGGESYINLNGVQLF